MALRHITGRRWGALGLALTLFVSVACSGSDSTQGAGSSDCTDLKQYGNLKGKSISVYYPNVDPEDKAYRASFRRFESCTGAKVKYEGTLELTAQLPVRVKAGTPPDIASIPQPGCSPRWSRPARSSPRRRPSAPTSTSSSARTGAPTAPSTARCTQLQVVRT